MQDKTAQALKDMSKVVHRLAKDKGWWRDQVVCDSDTTPSRVSVEQVEKVIPEKLMLIVSELSEALEEYRKGGRMSTYWHIEKLGTVSAHDVLHGFDKHGIHFLREVLLMHADRSPRVGRLNETRQFLEHQPLGADAREICLSHLKQYYKPEGFAIEMADAVIRIGDLMGALELDLGAAVVLKHRYNKTRPYRHGGKKV